MAPPNVMSRRLRVLVLLADVLWIFLSASLAFLLRYPNHGAWIDHSLDYPRYVFLACLAMGIWTFLFTRMRLDGFSDGWEPERVFSRVFIGVLLLMSGMLSVAFLAKEVYSRLLLAYFGTFLFAGFLLVRCVMRASVLSHYRNRTQQRVALMGSGRVARELAEKIQRHPELMKDVVGFLYPDTDLPVRSSPLVPLSQAVPSTSAPGIVELLKKLRVDEVVVVHPRTGASEIQKLLRLSRSAGLKVSLVPEGYELYLSKATFLDVEGLPILCLEERREQRLANILKRTADLIIASSLTVLAVPVILAGAATVMVEGRRPFKREARCGLKGTMFLMWRLNIDRDSVTLSDICQWFARLSLTELPQLFNVIAGDMSLVGPRPEPLERVKHYSEWQRQRLSAKPGLTGLAQVHGLRDQHSSEDKARFDLQYLLHWSLLLDLSLLVQTLWTVGTRLWRPAGSSVLAPQQNPVRTFTEVLDVDSSHAGAD